MSPLVSAYENVLRPVDRDLFRLLEEREQILDAILDRGIFPTDNMDAVHVSYTSNGTENTEDSVAHTLGKIPTGFIVVDINKGGVVYKSDTFTATVLKLKCSTATTIVKLLVY